MMRATSLVCLFFLVADMAFSQAVMTDDYRKLRDFEQSLPSLENAVIKSGAELGYRVYSRPGDVRKSLSYFITVLIFPDSTGNSLFHGTISVDVLVPSDWSVIKKQGQLTNLEVQRLDYLIYGEEVFRLPSEEPEASDLGIGNNVMDGGVIELSRYRLGDHAVQTIARSDALNGPIGRIAEALGALGNPLVKDAIPDAHPKPSP